ncbi:MAG TPA: hypothetical protein VGF79_14125, partial [Bacteroidia bacterium]
RLSLNDQSDPILFEGFESLINKVKVISIAQSNSKKHSSLLDCWIKDTICYFLDRILIRYPSLIIMFQIDNSDDGPRRSKSEMRLNKFKGWYNKFTETNHSDIIFKDFIVPSSEEFNSGFTIVGYIAHKDNEQADLIPLWETNIIRKIRSDKASF